MNCADGGASALIQNDVSLFFLLFSRHKRIPLSILSVSSQGPANAVGTDTGGAILCSMAINRIDREA
jgi:hypothetical protein